MKRLIAIAAAIAVLGLTTAAFAAPVANCCASGHVSSFHDYSTDHTAR